MLRFFGGSRPLMLAAKVAANEAAPASDPVLKGLLKPLPVSAAMRKFLGQSEISRSQIIKKIWEYVKAQQLQNPSNKREIMCDDKLKSIFDGKDKVGMLEIAKLVSPHFLKSK